LKQACKKRYEITAFIYDKKGKILSIGKNNYVKTHPLQSYHAEKAGEPYRQYLHAEIHAITRLPFAAKAHRIAIFRFDEQGKPAMSKPCKVCQSAIEAYGIKVVEHT
jgi:deoxycytidylate deaminase